MQADEVERAVRASVGKQIQVVFTDTVAVFVQVEWVDDEGFGYSGPEPSMYAREFELVRPEPALYWTPFGAVASITT